MRTRVSFPMCIKVPVAIAGLLQDPVPLKHFVLDIRELGNVQCWWNAVPLGCISVSEALVEADCFPTLFSMQICYVLFAYMFHCFVVLDLYNLLFCTKR